MKFIISVDKYFFNVSIIRHCHGNSVCMLSCFSRVQLFVTPWHVAHRAPLSMGFSQQVYWNGLLCPPPGDLPNLGIGPVSACVSCICRQILYQCITWEAQWKQYYLLFLFQPLLNFLLDSFFFP